MVSPLNDPNLEALLNRLHAQSDAQVGETDAYFERREQEGSLDYENFCDDDMHSFLADKLVALDRDKAEFCYQLCRSLRATRVVEAGTSFGISTLYLAAAVRDNQVENGVVIGHTWRGGIDPALPLREADLLRIEGHEGDHRRAGMAPAAGAVAVSDSQGLADGLVADRSAHAAAGYRFRFGTHDRAPSRIRVLQDTHDSAKLAVTK